MRIRIIRAPRGEADGVDLRTLEVGRNYDVSPAVGAHLVSIRCGELIPSQEPMMLVPVDEAVGYGVSSSHTAMSDDRGRRFDSILAFEPADTPRK